MINILFQIRSSFTEVSSKLKALKGVTLNVANRVYVQEGPYDLEPKLKEDAVKVFDAAIEKLDFNTGAAAVNVINKWVGSSTNKYALAVFCMLSFRKNGN